MMISNTDEQKFLGRKLVSDFKQYHGALSALLLQRIQFKISQ